MSAVPYTSGFLFRFAVFLVCNLILTQLDENGRHTNFFQNGRQPQLFSNDSESNLKQLNLN